MITPRLEAGENLFETMREKFNALAEAVDRLGQLESATPLLDVVDTGAGRVIRWNGAEPEPPAAREAASAGTGYAGPFCVELTGTTTARIFDGADPQNINAGTVTVGSVHHSMPAGTITVSAGFVVYLTVRYDSTAQDLVYSYASSLTSAVTGAQGWYRELARVGQDGKLRQVHFGGDIEIAGRWCE